MRKSERISRAVLIFLVMVALVAIGLQIFNEKTNPLETTYEIITFSTAFACVVMAVLQGIVNARTTRDLTKITREIRELMQNVERDEKRDIALKKEVKKDLEIDQRELEIIAKEIETEKK
jgi:septal ring factor EnvC (AmiA/AmiB activator)